MIYCIKYGVFEGGYTVYTRVYKLYTSSIQAVYRSIQFKALRDDLMCLDHSTGHTIPGRLKALTYSLVYHTNHAGSYIVQWRNITNDNTHYHQVE